MLFVFWLACGVIGAIIGSRKGQGCAGALLSLILGPVGVTIVAVSSGNRKPCRFCRELIDPKAIVCPRCQRDNPTV